MTRHDVRVSLQQMRDHAEEAIGLCDGRSLNDLLTDRSFGLALERLLYILGEAAVRVPLETREGLSDIPWAEIIAVRNRLAHAYDKLDRAILWDIVNADLPPLIERLEAALSELP